MPVISGFETWLASRFEELASTGGWLGEACERGFGAPGVLYLVSMSLSLLVIRSLYSCSLCTRMISRLEARMVLASIRGIGPFSLGLCGLRSKSMGLLTRNGRQN